MEELGQVKKNKCFSSRFLVLLFPTFLLFPIECFLNTLLPSPRDKFEFSGQIIIIKETPDIDQTQVCFMLLFYVLNNVT